MGHAHYVLSPGRWYILFAFCFFALVQDVIWLTYSPIAPVVEVYYGVDESTVFLFLNWGAIILLPAMPFVAWMLSRPGGLRRTTRAAAVVMTVGAYLRCIPSIWPEAFEVNSGKRATNALVLLHAAAILNAMVGPCIFGAYTKLSGNWFATNERTTSTAIASLASNVGTGIGFVMMPNIVQTPEQMPTLLWVHAGLASAALIVVFAYFPDRPPHPPSPAAEADVASTATSRDFARGFKTAFLHPSFMLVATVGGVINGVFNGWQANLSTLLSSEYSVITTGWFGFASTFAQVVGGVGVGPLTDRVPALHHRFKLLLLLTVGGSMLCFVWTVLSVPFAPGDAPLIPGNAWSVGAAVSLSAFILGATTPLPFEFGVELIYPVSEAISAGIIMLFTTVATLVFLFVAPTLSASVVNLVMPGTALVCFVLLFFVREDYRRGGAEKRSEDGYVAIQHEGPG